jgi:D-proline reductase (dithiol) PrdA
LDKFWGAKLTQTVDALTPLTKDVLEGVKAAATADPVPAPASAMRATGTVPTEQATSMGGGFVKVYIAEGKGINLEIPVGDQGAASLSAEPAVVDKIAEPKIEDKVKRTLKILEFPVKEVKIGEVTKFEDGVLTIRGSLADEALDADQLTKEITIDVITPDNRNIYTNTMMDVSPIATKVEGNIGEGITYEMTGAVIMLTGVDENGKQVADANSSDGILAEHVKFGRPGCPDEGDIIIRIHAVIEKNTGMERVGPYAAHKSADVIVQEIREVLKKMPADKAAGTKVHEEIERQGRPRIVLVKEIMGQGAMHDNLILPSEPAGVTGGRPNVDLGNLPVVFSPNEVFDGGIHALTCITPATKETTRHYWREPVVKRLAEDEELNLVAVVFIGSPQANTEKFYVSERLGKLVEAMNVDGAIVTTEGFGNNHIDFASHIEQIGMRGVPVVGMSFAAIQGALVVGNKYMDAMVEMSKSVGGVESDILEDNSITDDDAIRAVAMLKNKMMGVAIKPADRKWNDEVLKKNNELAKKTHK